MITLLSLDLGMTTGFATWNHSGAKNFAPKKLDGKGARWNKFYRWLIDIVESEGITTIAYERVDRHVGTQAAHVYGGFLALLEMVADVREIELICYGPGQIKKFATGKGNATKAAMVVAAGKMRPAAIIEDDNHADAICIWAMGASALGMAVSA